VFFLAGGHPLVLYLIFCTAGHNDTIAMSYDSYDNYLHVWHCDYVRVRAPGDSTRRAGM
jgi:hypothetical protein